MKVNPGSLGELEVRTAVYWLWWEGKVGSREASYFMLLPFHIWGTLSWARHKDKGRKSQSSGHGPDGFPGSGLEAFVWIFKDWRETDPSFEDQGLRTFTCGFKGLRPARSMERVLGQPGLQGEILSWKNKRKKRNKESSSLLLNSGEWMMS